MRHFALAAAFAFACAAPAPADFPAAIEAYRGLSAQHLQAAVR